VRIIVGFAAGGGADITTRLIGQWLSQRLGQQFIVENRPGVSVGRSLIFPDHRQKIFRTLPITGLL
jgi:hypothetical protein